MAKSQLQEYEKHRHKLTKFVSLPGAYLLTNLRSVLHVEATAGHKLHV